MLSLHCLAGMTDGEEKYRTALGIIVMCMHCRRTLSKEGTHWDLVEEFIQNRPVRVSDGLCGDCLERHYPRRIE